jgi:hypothetical protein
MFQENSCLESVREESTSSIGPIRFEPDERIRRFNAGRLLVFVGDDCRTNSSAFPDVRIRDWTID